MATGPIKKKWIQILAPKGLGEKPVGETYIASPDIAINRRVSTSLTNVTGDSAKQNIQISLRITGKSGDALQTSIMAYRIVPSAVRKLMRKKRSKVEDSFVTKTKDGIIVRLKPLLIAKGKTKGSVLALLKKKCREFVASNTASLTFNEFIKKIIDKRFQKSLQSALKKVHPVIIAEMRMASIVEGKKAEKVKLIKANA